MALMMASLRPVFFCASARRLLVGLQVGEVERIGGAELEVDEFVAGLEQVVDAAAGVDAEVVAAFGADLLVGLDFGLEDDLAAAGALDPEALGADASSPASLTISLSSRLNQAICVLSLIRWGAVSDTAVRVRHRQGTYRGTDSK